MASRAALGIARAQRRRQDLLQQGRLAVRGGPEDAQVASRDAIARELDNRADDLALGVVEPGRAPALLARDHAVILQLLDELGVGTRLVDDVLERVDGARTGLGEARTAAEPGRRIVGRRRARGDLTLRTA